MLKSTYYINYKEIQRIIIIKKKTDKKLVKKQLLNNFDIDCSIKERRSASKQRKLKIKKKDYTNKNRGRKWNKYDEEEKY